MEMMTNKMNKIYFEVSENTSDANCIKSENSLPIDWPVYLSSREEAIQAHEVPMGAEAWDAYCPDDMAYLGRRVPYLTFSETGFKSDSPKHWND